MSTTTLDVDGPRTADYAREVAGSMAEAIRVLNHVTGSPDTLSEPADVYDVLGTIGVAAHSLPQLFRQLREALDAHADTGRLKADDPDERDGASYDVAIEALKQAESRVKILAEAVGTAHQRAGRLYLREEG